MACLLITYDLNRPGQNYAALHEEIKNLGTSWWHYLDSTWLVSTSVTASVASERLVEKMDNSDNLLVLNVSSVDYAGWLPEEAWAWIRQNLAGAHSRY